MAVDAGANIARVRQIGAATGISIIVGSVVGNGILSAPAIVAGFSTSLMTMSALWLVGALMCMAGACVYGELGRRYPSGGGPYVFLRETLGPGWSAAYGAMSSFVICPSMIAATALLFSAQLKLFAPALNESELKLAAAVLVVFFSFLNTRGINIAGGVQKALVTAHLALMVGVVALALWMSRSGSFQFASYDWLPAPQPSLSLNQGVLAFVAILWSFEGFNSLSFITNELSSGARLIKRVSVYGCLAVFAIYFLILVSAVALIPAGELSRQTNVLVALANLSMGGAASASVAIVTILGIATVLHTSIIIGPRITKVMIDDGFGPRAMAKLHPESTSPNRAIWLQCAFVLGFLWVGQFNSLISCFIISNWFFYAATVTGYLRVRFNEDLRVSSWEFCGSVIFVFATATLFASQILDTLTAK